MKNNLEAFKALKKRYETITLAEIKKAKCNKTILTGFAGNFTCTLCKAINYKHIENDCSKCIWYKTNKGDLNHYPCQADKNGETYSYINKARTPNKLLKAYWLRAKHMEDTLRKLNLE